jgi:alpha-ribazole phosphatase/probable phosphoglycerate mutase
MHATRIYLIRHGQVVNHHEYRYNGHYDVDITNTGVEQMTRVCEFLSSQKIDAVYSSDLQRTVKGARIIGKRLGLEPVMVHSLRELNLGRWEGLTREEAIAMYPEDAHFSFKDLATSKVKEGESLVELRARVIPALEDIIARHAHRSVCIVAHGGVNRVILSEAMSLPLDKFFRIEQDYGCLNIIDYLEDGMKVVKLLNGGPNQDMRPTEIY